MVQPIDYSLKAVNPIDSVMGGIQQGVGLQQLQLQKAQAAAQLQQQQALKQALTQLGQKTNPTAQDYVAVANLMPSKEAESLRENFKLLDESQKTARLQTAGEMMAALDADPAVALQMMKTNAEASRNAGDDKQAQAWDTWAQLAEINPGAVRQNFGVMLSQLPGGDKVIEGITKLGTERRASASAPAELSKVQSEAAKAATDAKFAESNAAADLLKKNWDITKIQEDIGIKKENLKIAAMNADLARAKNDTERAALAQKIQAANEKRDGMVRDRAAQASALTTQTDNLLNSLTQLTQYDRSKLDNATGPVDNMLPTLREDTAAIEDLVETIKSQISLARIGELKGATSDKDLAALAASLQNLSTRGGTDNLLKNAQEAIRLTNKIRSDISLKYGTPETAPDVPAAQQGQQNQQNAQAAVQATATAGQPAADGLFYVTLPDGNSIRFKDAASAAEARRRLGLQGP